MNEQVKPWTRRAFLLASTSAALSACAVPARRLATSPTIDGLSFLPDDPGDIARTGLDAFVLDVSKGEYIEEENGLSRYVRTFEACDEGLDTAVESIRNDYPDVYIVTRGSAVDPGRGTAVFLQFQSCNPIGDRLERIEYFARKGIRLLQITHHHNNPFGGGALEANQIGLTALGRDGVAEMNRLGIIPDVSHASDATTFDTVRASSSPVIISHGACRALVDNPRCASDAMIRAVADSGGAMGIFMMSFWLTTDPVPTADHYVAHIRHLVNVGGIDAAAIANDYTVSGQMDFAETGNDNQAALEGYQEWWKSIAARNVPGYDTLPSHVVIPELNNVRRAELIRRALRKARFSSTETDKIMGVNWLRVLTGTLG